MTWLQIRWCNPIMHYSIAIILVSNFIHLLDDDDVCFYFASVVATNFKLIHNMYSSASTFIFSINFPANPWVRLYKCLCSTHLFSPGKRIGFKFINCSHVLFPTNQLWIDSARVYCKILINQKPKRFFVCACIHGFACNFHDFFLLSELKYTSPTWHRQRKSFLSVLIRLETIRMPAWCFRSIALGSVGREGNSTFCCSKAQSGLIKLKLFHTLGSKAIREKLCPTHTMRSDDDRGGEFFP